MRKELNFISKALKLDSGIVFETPIAHLIPRIPMASIIGNSSLLSCGGYSTTLKLCWHLTFLPEITTRTLLHLKDNSDKSFISINSLKFVTIILNYCASLIVFAIQKSVMIPIQLCFASLTTRARSIGPSTRVKIWSLAVPWQDSSAASWLAQE